MITSGFQEPSILRIPSIARKSAFPEGGFFVQNLPLKLVSSPETLRFSNPQQQILTRNSPSYVPQDSPFSRNKQSSNFPEKMSNGLMNSKGNTDFEDLLLSFKVKYKGLEEKVQRLLAENDKLNEIVEKSFENARTCKEKIELLLRENERLQEATKRILPSNYKAFSFDEEIESKTHVIISQNEQLNLTIREQFKELDLWKDKFKEKGIEYMRLEADYQNEKSLSSMLQEKVVSLSKETEKINRLLLEKYTETNTFSNKIKNIEEKIRTLEFENHRLKQNEGFFEKEKSEFKRHLQLAYAENDKLLKSLEEKEAEFNGIRDLEAKMEILLTENNKLTETLDKLAEKHRLEKRQWEDNYKEKSLEIEIRQGLENKTKVLLGENEKLTEIIERKNQELAAFEQLEAKIELLVVENEKLNKALIEKRNEVEYWKKRYFEQM